MQILLSVCYQNQVDLFSKISDCLSEYGHNIYPKSIKGALGVPRLYDIESLDYFLRDEDMVVAVISKDYLADKWLVAELHVLYALEKKLKRNFVFPILYGDIDEQQIPDICLHGEYVDFRKKSEKDALVELAEKIKTFTKPKLLVFISHTKKDEKIAEALSNLIETAFKLAPSDIICTSVQGHRLPLAANTNETLLRLIFEAKVFICIATENSLGTPDQPGSFYVAVELGARWGMKRFLAVMLAAGATGSNLRAPFNVLNALSCEDAGQVQQFIDQIGPYLEKPPLTPNTYYKNVQNLVTASKEAKKAVAQMTNGQENDDIIPFGPVGAARVAEQ